MVCVVCFVFSVSLCLFKSQMIILRLLDSLSLFAWPVFIILIVKSTEAAHAIYAPDAVNRPSISPLIGCLFYEPNECPTDSIT